VRRARKKAGLSGLFLCSLLSIAPSAAEPLTLEIVRAAPSRDQRSGEPIITFTMAETSKQRFSELTARNVGRKLEIRWMDEPCYRR
jgi:hypothetical protein